MLTDAYTERIQTAGPLKAYLRAVFDWTLEPTPEKRNKE